MKMTVCLNFFISRRTVPLCYKPDLFLLMVITASLLLSLRPPIWIFPLYLTSLSVDSDLNISLSHPSQYHNLFVFGVSSPPTLNEFFPSSSEVRSLCFYFHHPFFLLLAIFFVSEIKQVHLSSNGPCPLPLEREGPKTVAPWTFSSVSPLIFSLKNPAFSPCSHSPPCLFPSFDNLDNFLLSPLFFPCVP